MTSDHIVVGIVRGAGEGRRRDTEVVRGLRLWAEAVRSAGGLRYTPFAHASFELRVADGGRTPQTAARAARGLLDRGATYLVTPANHRQLAPIAAMARPRRAMLLSAVPRPSAVQPSVLNTFLARANPAAMSGALDSIDLFQRERGLDRNVPRGHIAILYDDHRRWRRRVPRVAHDAKRRGYVVESVRVDPGAEAEALARLNARPRTAVLTLGPPRRSIGWFRRGRRAGPGTPWVMLAEDVRDALGPVAGSSFAIETSWSPTTPPIAAPFPLKPGFTPRYRRAHGRLPGPDAAAGAALGYTIGDAIVAARSTDPSRVLKARDSREIATFYGAMDFRRGEQAPVRTVLILVQEAEIIAVGVDPRPKLLIFYRSVSSPPREGVRPAVP